MKKDGTPKVEVYTGMLCSYCTLAKFLLKKKQVAFKEIFVSFHPSRRAEMIQRAGGRRSIPQIFINDRHIGGYMELYALDQDGKLDQLPKP